VSRKAADPAPDGTTAAINLFEPAFHVDETLAEIRQCLEAGWTGLGFKTLDFEAAWTQYTGLPHAHFLNSATAGLHLALRVLKDADGWAPGDEVVTTPLTFVSTNHVILHEGLRPVFADVDEYLCLDPESVAERIGPRTRAVMFVGLGGNTGRLPEVAAVCRARGVRLVLDASHMAGTRWRGAHTGGESDAAVFSFQAVKNLATADAGMVCFADAGLDAEARRWSWLGIDRDTYSRTVGGGSYKWQYDVPHVGFKYHGNSVMAAMALVGLRHLDADNARRRALADRYDARLAGRVERVPTAPECESSRHLYQVLVDGRDEVMLALNGRRIHPGVHYAINTQYRMFSDAPGPCPRAVDASRRVISLPLHLRLSASDVYRVSDALTEIVAEGRDDARG
jgi:dTDP-4-amino-4,6-dideoxygalactose transaminase